MKNQDVTSFTFLKIIAVPSLSQHQNYIIIQCFTSQILGFDRCLIIREELKHFIVIFLIWIIILSVRIQRFFCISASMNWILLVRMTCINYPLGNTFIMSHSDTHFLFFMIVVNSFLIHIIQNNVLRCSVLFLSNFYVQNILQHLESQQFLNLWIMLIQQLGLHTFSFLVSEMYLT